MDLSIPGSTNSPLSTSLTPVFGDNVQDLLNAGTLNVNPSAIITVNSTSDAVDDPSSGVTTLRDAINQANGDTGFDLIVFDRELFSNAQTITLSQGELDLTHNLDIIAPRDSLTGADLVTVSGNKASRVFEIGSGATVNLDGWIVADGSVLGDDGGGIKNSGTLILDNSIVRNNSTTSSGNFDNSIGGDGGGIYNSGILTVSNSTINSNSAIKLETISGGDGGGIFNYNTLDVSDSTISGNFADAYGGGIGASYLFKSFSDIITTISNSTISGNFALNGGGISSGGAILEVNNSTLSNNTARFDGGGISNYFSNLSNSNTLKVNNSTISDNKAGKGNGGGIFNNGDSTVNNSIISGNMGSYYGGGIFNDGDSTVDNTIISGSLASLGGGIYNSRTLKVNNSTISGNKASSGGGIYNTRISTVDNSTLSGNSGFGIYNYGTLTLVFSTVTANSSGIYNHPSSTLYPTSISVRNTIIAANLTTKDGVNPDVSGTFTSEGYNLIGDSTGSTGFDATGDIVGTSDNPIDPRLAPLDFYGGSTQTIALLPDSPAISAGDPTVLDTDPTTDQRGLPRRASDGSADIGAFEFSS